ncbi:TPA: esterase/lipase family protein [Providencia alcalifaciens]
MTDKSDKSATPTECQHVSYHLPQWDENGKCSWIDIQLQHKSLNAEAKCIVPPTKVIPVIFIPGIMGTNLKKGKEQGGEAVWRGDHLPSVLFKWSGRSGKTRSDLLNPETTFVDNRGDINNTIHTPFSDDGCLFPSRRERGWGEALAFSYSQFLSVFQGALVDDWQCDVVGVKQVRGYSFKARGILNELVGKRFNTEEAENESVLTSDELTHFKRFLYPVHVFGYNWLQDNAISAAHLANYIDEILDLYRYEHGYGLATEKVILVTHSMGGLVARYAMNPAEGSFNGYQDKVLGVIHGVIPDLGSPAAYRRMKTGAGQEGLAGNVLGATAEELMPVLAKAPAALQLLPYPKYKSPWLIIDGDNNYPKADGADPFTDIYLRNDVWWKLYQSDIIDSDKVIVDKNWKSYIKLVDIDVRNFMTHQEQGLYHPNTYIFYGKTVDSDATLKWHKTTLSGVFSSSGFDNLPQNHYRVMQGNTVNEYKLKSSNSQGDGTVPVESLLSIRYAAKSVLATNVEHQSAYGVENIFSANLLTPAVKFTLRSIIKIVHKEVSHEAAN